MEVELVSERVRQAASLLAGLDIAALDAEGVRTVLGELRTERTHSARLEMDLTARAADLCSAGAGDDPIDLLTGVAAMPSARARRVVRNAELLARMPVLAGAVRAASVTDDHVEVVAIARRRLDPAVRSRFDALDDEITSCALHHTPDRLAEQLRFLQRRLERDHTREGDVRRRRAVRVAKWIDRDGAYQMHGTFDPEMGSRIFGAIDTAIERLRHQTASLVPGGNPNDPLASDREFLGAHALARLVTHGHTADRPGTPEVVVLVDERTLVHGEHPGTVSELHDGTAVDPELVRRLCCEAVLTAVVVSANGTVPLDVGRSQRTATRAQRRALRAVHRTCAIGGCTTSFDQCEVHHILFWDLAGLTDLANLVPLCLRHHHLVHDMGWRLELVPTDRMLTLRRPDGSVACRTTPPGLRISPLDDGPAELAAAGRAPPGGGSTTAA